MATRIRLRRVGRKGQSYFRIVVADSRSPRDGRFVVTLGHYNPRTNPADIQVDAEQARAWLDKGALPTDTVHTFLRKTRSSICSRSSIPTAGLENTSRAIGLASRIFFSSANSAPSASACCFSFASSSSDCAYATAVGEGRSVSRRG